MRGLSKYFASRFESTMPHRKVKRVGPTLSSLIIAATNVIKMVTASNTPSLCASRSQENENCYASAYIATKHDKQYRNGVAANRSVHKNCQNKKPKEKTSTSVAIAKLAISASNVFINNEVVYSDNAIENKDLSSEITVNRPSSECNYQGEETDDIQNDLKNVTTNLRRLSTDKIDEKHMSMQHCIDDFLELNMKKSSPPTGSAASPMSAVDVSLQQLYMSTLLVLFAPQDRKVGKLFVEYLTEAFPIIKVKDVSDSIYGCNVLDFWEDILNSTSYVIIFMSKNFLQYVSERAGMKVALHHMNQARTMIVPIYLESVIFNYTNWWFDFENRQGISINKNSDSQLKYLHRYLKSIFEEDVNKKYNLQIVLGAQ